MSKLSLRKKNDKNKKITGFFASKGKMNDDKNEDMNEDKNEDISRTVLQNIENKIPKELDNILVSPKVQKFDCNEIEVTPDLAYKSKRKRTDDISNEENGQLSGLTSPVFKKSKSVSYTSPIKNPSPIKKADCDELWEEENDDFMACFDDSFVMSPSKSSNKY